MMEHIQGFGHKDLHTPYHKNGFIEPKPKEENTKG